MRLNSESNFEVRNLIDLGIAGTQQGDPVNFKRRKIGLKMKKKRKEKRKYNRKNGREKQRRKV
jgi:hypothetical protein